MPKEIPSCKKFTGYKPCYPDHNCWTEGCKDNIAIGTKILIINQLLCRELKKIVINI